MADVYSDFVNAHTTSPSQDSGNDPYSAFISSHANPSDVTQATNEASDPNSTQYSGMCQQFVDDIIGTPPENRAPSASQAWQNYQTNGQAVQGTSGIKPGDLIYFQDPKNSDGHVGFYTGGDNFVSATQQDPNHPVQTQSISAWQDLTGDSILGYVNRGGTQ